MHYTKKPSWQQVRGEETIPCTFSVCLLVMVNKSFNNTAIILYAAIIQMCIYYANVYTIIMKYNIAT